jgi:hypothetical protein
MISVTVGMSRWTDLLERSWGDLAGVEPPGGAVALTVRIMAVTGLWPAAAAWSTNEEERRKALMSYFLSPTSCGTTSRAARRSRVPTSRSPAPPRTIPTASSA